LMVSSMVDIRCLISVDISPFFSDSLTMRVSDSSEDWEVLDFTLNTGGNRGSRRRLILLRLLSTALSNSGRSTSLATTTSMESPSRPGASH